MSDVMCKAEIPPLKTDKPGAYGTSDKLNCVDYHWFVVRSLPHQERKLADLFREHLSEIPNILEVYCPTHTTVGVSHGGREEQMPLFAGYVFVLSTRQAIDGFLSRYYPSGTVLYDSRRRAGRRPDLLTIPEEQMRFFMDFNENYADRVVILERPYSDYAFNPKSGEPNEIVRVLNGPLAGREGYLVRFRRDKRLVFHMRALESDSYYTVSIPHIWDFQVVRLHNAESGFQSFSTQKERAADLLLGLLEGCGCGSLTLSMFHDIMETLVRKPSLVDLCRDLSRRGYETVSRCLLDLDADSAGLLLNLVRYERDNPGYLRDKWSRYVFRSFLTPTAGVLLEEGREEAVLHHSDFTEFIHRVDITEEVYYPSQEAGGSLTDTYYAHIGLRPSFNDEWPGCQLGCFTLFANWDTFLEEYFLTAGKANEKLVSGMMQSAIDEKATGEEKGKKLIESFRNYAPTLYKVLVDDKFPVKAICGFRVGKELLNVLAISALSSDLLTARNILISTCVDICREISTTTHLSVWRRYLRTVWLHR